MCPNRVTTYIRKPEYSQIQDDFQLEEEESWSSDSANDNGSEEEYEDPTAVTVAKEDIDYYGMPQIEYCSDDFVVPDLLREKIRGKKYFICIFYIFYRE